MTFCARRYRHVRFQSTKRCGFGDVDVTGRTFINMLLLLAAALVNKLDRDSCRIAGGGVRRRRKLMTAVTVVRNGLLRFPVTVEARRMFGRHCLEGRGTLPVTDSAVVVVLRRMREPQHRDHVLVLVMRKLDRELQF